jgi:hypothetical protein
MERLPTLNSPQYTTTTLPSVGRLSTKFPPPAIESASPAAPDPSAHLPPVKAPIITTGRLTRAQTRSNVHIPSPSAVIPAKATRGTKRKYNGNTEPTLGKNGAAKRANDNRAANQPRVLSTRLSYPVSGQVLSTRQLRTRKHDVGAKDFGYIAFMVYPIGGGSTSTHCNICPGLASHPAWRAVQLCFADYAILQGQMNF